MNVLIAEAIKILHENMNVITKAVIKNFFTTKCVILKLEYYVNIHKVDEYKKKTVYKIQFNKKGNAVTTVIHDNIVS